MVKPIDWARNCAPTRCGDKFTTATLLPQYTRRAKQVKKREKKRERRESLPVELVAVRAWADLKTSATGRRHQAGTCTHSNQTQRGKLTLTHTPYPPPSPE